MATRTLTIITVKEVYEFYQPTQLDKSLHSNARRSAPSVLRPPEHWSCSIHLNEQMNKTITLSSDFVRNNNFYCTFVM